MHPDFFPFIYFGRTENRTYFIWAFGHADVVVQYSEVRFSVSLEPDQILLFFD
jgi:hypothetical protein